MGLRRSILAAGLCVTILNPSICAAEGKFSAWVFGDYYYFTDSHDSTFVDENGFWFRLIDLTWDEKIDDTFSARLRLESCSPGSFVDNPQLLLVYTKDAWVKWTWGRQALILGLSMPPSHSFTEEMWGYRYLEKQAFELAGFGGSRDMGLGFTGSLLEGNRFGYHFMVANGNGLLNEQDARKRVSGSLRFHLTGELALEAYGDYEPRANNADRMTFRGFAVYRSGSIRAGAEYVQQTRDRAAGGSYDLRTVSGFLSGRVAGNVWLLGRVDRHMDEDPGYKPGLAPGRPYLPYDASVASTFVLAGLEYQARENVYFSPNVEMVLYDSPKGGGPAPLDDVVGRLTFMFKY